MRGVVVCWCVCIALASGETSFVPDRRALLEQITVIGEIDRLLVLTPSQVEVRVRLLTADWVVDWKTALTSDLRFVVPPDDMPADAELVAALTTLAQRLTPDVSLVPVAYRSAPRPHEAWIRAVVGSVYADWPRLLQADPAVMSAYTPRHYAGVQRFQSIRLAAVAIADLQPNTPPLPAPNPQRPMWPTPPARDPNPAVPPPAKAPPSAWRPGDATPSPTAP